MLWQNVGHSLNEKKKNGGKHYAIECDTIVSASASRGGIDKQQKEHLKYIVVCAVFSWENLQYGNEANNTTRAKVSVDNTVQSISKYGGYI